VAVSTEEEYSSEAAPARGRLDGSLYGRCRERVRERGCVGGEMKFNFPSNRFSTKTKKKRGKNKIK
jgi:hypothetical protein